MESARGLLRIDMLAGLHRRKGNSEMGVRHGEIEDQIDVLAGQQFSGRHGPHRIFPGPRLCHVRIKVGAGRDLNSFEQGRQTEISGRNITASHHTNVKIASHCHSSVFLGGDQGTASKSFGITRLVVFHDVVHAARLP